MTIFNTQSKVKLTIEKGLPNLENYIPPTGLMGVIRICNADTKVQTDSWIIVSESTSLDISSLKVSDRVTIDKAFEDHVNKNPISRALSNFGPSKRNVFYSAIWLPNSVVSKYI